MPDTLSLHTPALAPRPTGRAVVVGAGFGGLAAALRLAAAGWAVTVVEAAATPGGKARGVPTPAGPAATGPTVLTLIEETRALFALHGARAEDRVDLVPLPRLARHHWPDGTTLDLFADAEANAAAIETLAGPREAAAFRRFDRLTRALWQAFEAPVMQAARPQLGAVMRAALARPALWPALAPGTSVQGFLRGIFRDPRLVQLFGRYATYVGGRPAHTPAVLSLIWQAEAQGVWAPRGGVQALAAALADLAVEAGVTFRYGTRAGEIVTDRGRVAAVRLAGGAAIPCDICVFNGDPGALAEGRHGAAAARAVPGGARPSLSAWVWAFAAAPAGPAAAGLAHHTVVFTADPAAEFGPIGRGKMPVAPTLYLCAQDRELGTPVPAPERFQIIMNGPAGAPAPADEETTCRTTVFQTLAAQGLTFSPAPPAAGLLTPALLAARHPGSQGAIYGASPEGMLAPFRRPRARTALPGLYLAGGGAHPGAGVPMVIRSGRLAAEAIAADRISA